MSQAGETFFTSVGCMDGRVVEPIINYGRQKFGVMFGDTITEAGLVGLLSKEFTDEKLLDSLKQKIQISLDKHLSKGIVIHGHQECAGNPVADDKHKDDVRKSVEIIRSVIGLHVPIVGVFVKRQDSSWVVEELSQTAIA